jgi:hypothetical protein
MQISCVAAVRRPWPRGSESGRRRIHRADPIASSLPATSRILAISAWQRSGMLSFTFIISITRRAAVYPGGHASGGGLQAEMGRR